MEENANPKLWLGAGRRRWNGMKQFYWLAREAPQKSRVEPPKKTRLGYRP